MYYFFDSYAIIEILRGNPAYAGYRETPIVTTLSNFGEVYYSLLKTYDEQTAATLLEKMKFYFIDLSEETVKEAMRLRYHHKKLKLSYIDCFGYVLAKNNNIPFLTGDQAFVSLENVAFVK